MLLLLATGATPAGAQECAPRWVTYIERPHGLFDVAAGDRYVVADTGSLWTYGSLEFFDVSDPLAPRFAGSLEAGELADGWLVLSGDGGPAIAGDHVLVRVVHRGEPDEFAIAVLDIADPANPREVARIDGFLGLERPTIENDRLYVLGVVGDPTADRGTWRRVLVSYDIRVPDNPVELARVPFDVSLPSGELGLAFGNSFWVRGGYVYALFAGDEVRRLAIFDMRDHVVPHMASDTLWLGRSALAVYEDYALLLHWASPMRIDFIDTTDKTAPYISGSTTVPGRFGSTVGARVIGNRLYLVDFVVGSVPVPATLDVLELQPPDAVAVLASPPIWPDIHQLITLPHMVGTDDHVVYVTRVNTADEGPGGGLYVFQGCPEAPPPPPLEPAIAWEAPMPASVEAGAPVTLRWSLAGFDGPITQHQAHYGVTSVLGSSEGMPAANGTYEHTFTVPSFPTPTNLLFVVRAFNDGEQVLSSFASTQVLPDATPPAVTWVTPPPAQVANGGRFTVQWEVSGFDAPLVRNGLAYGITSILGQTANQLDGNRVYTATFQLPLLSSSLDVRFAPVVQAQGDATFLMGDPMSVHVPVP